MRLSGYGAYNYDGDQEIPWMLSKKTQQMQLKSRFRHQIGKTK